MPAPATAPEPTQSIERSFSLESYQIKKRRLEQARKAIETCCLKPFNPKGIPGKNGSYRLNIPHEIPDQPTEIIDILIDDMQEIATSRQCYLIATLTDPDTGQRWE